jgi:hypothetical protein
MSRWASPQPDSDPAVQRMMVESRERQANLFVRRERWVELLVAGAFLATAVPIAILLSAGPALDPLLAAALVIAYAIATRVQFHTGAGWTDPTQLVFVPMLFLLPTPTVPLFVAAGLLLGKSPEYLTGELNLERAATRIGDAWYAVGPALLITLADATGPQWGDWPIYVAALGAQFGLDIARATVGGFGLGLDPRKHLRELGSVYVSDALLAPIGLLAAFAAAEQEWAFVLVLPLVGLIAIFARERGARIENALTLSQAYRGTAHLLEEFLSASNEYTGFHSRSVVDLAHDVGMAIGLDETGLRDLELGALLHDVGKINVPNEILDKPGPLTDEEMAVMRRHTVDGERMLARIGGVLAQVGRVVRSHHENYDGSGYPDGLRGDEIPVAARVISCCDAFNAMTTDRPYRSAMSLDAAIAELRANAGTQFDPKVASALIEIVRSWEAAAVAERAQPERVGIA